MAVVQMMPPLGVVALAAIGWFLLKRPRSIFVYIVIPFIVGHSLVAHKEYRFLFPLALPVTFMLGIVLQATVIAGWKAVALKAFAAFNLLWLIALPYRPASFEVMFYRHVYESGIREIYSMDRDPYTVADLAVHFYRPPDLDVHLVSLAEVERLTAVGSIHLFTTGLRPFAANELLASRCQADYRSVPAWVERVNINDWVSRVPIWSVYRCGPTGEKAG